jgi:hypothetical protein
MRVIGAAAVSGMPCPVPAQTDGTGLAVDFRLRSRVTTPVTGPSPYRGALLALLSGCGLGGGSGRPSQKCHRRT